MVNLTVGVRRDRKVMMACSLGRMRGLTPTKSKPSPGRPCARKWEVGPRAQMRLGASMSDGPAIHARQSGRLRRTDAAGTVCWWVPHGSRFKAEAQFPETEPAVQPPITGAAESSATRVWWRTAISVDRWDKS